MSAPISPPPERKSSRKSGSCTGIDEGASFTRILDAHGQSFDATATLAHLCDGVIALTFGRGGAATIRLAGGKCIRRQDSAIAVFGGQNVDIAGGELMATAILSQIVSNQRRGLSLQFPPRKPAIE